MSELKTTIVADLAFGDAGKGTIIDTLARKCEEPIVVRFNGGGQAAHNVITPDGRHHTFSQFGSGTFVPGARTFLSRFMLVDPHELVREAERLEESGVPQPLTRMLVHPDALVVSPYHKAANRIREYLRGAAGHGTCGMGIGETMQDATIADAAVHVYELRNEKVLAKKFAFIQERKRSEFAPHLTLLLNDERIRAETELLFDLGSPEIAADLYRRASQRFQIVDEGVLQNLSAKHPLLFEGAQGALLDEWRGFHPHTTWSTTTFANALTVLADIGYQGEVERLGVLRAYHTRHGAGPFPTENETLTRLLPDPHNGDRGWQGLFRSGWFDFVMARYALAITGGADALAITNIDRFSFPNRKFCTQYRTPNGELLSELRAGSVGDLAYQEGLSKLIQESEPLYEPAPDSNDEYLEVIERTLRVPVTIASYGPTALDKRFRKEACAKAA